MLKRLGKNMKNNEVMSSQKSLGFNGKDNLPSSQRLDLVHKFAF